MQTLNLQVTAPSAKNVGEEMIVEVNLPSGTPVQVTLKPEVKPNETIVATVQIPSNKTNTSSNYVHPSNSNGLKTENYGNIEDGNIYNYQEESVNYNKKEDLLLLMPLAARFYFKLVRVLEDSKDTRRNLVIFITIYIVIVWAIGSVISWGNGKWNFATFNFSFIKGFINLIAFMIIVFRTFKYFNDKGKDFYTIWTNIRGKEKKSVNRIMYFFAIINLVILVVFGSIAILTLVAIIVNPENAPVLARIQGAFRCITLVLFPLFTVPCFILSIYAIIAASYGATRNIKLISNNLLQKLQQSAIEKVCDESILNELTFQLKSSSKKISKTMKSFGVIIGLFLINNLLNIIEQVLDVSIKILEKKAFGGWDVFTPIFNISTETYLLSLMLSYTIILQLNTINLSMNCTCQIMYGVFQKVMEKMNQHCNIFLMGWI
jgi:hypothetical protein